MTKRRAPLTIEQAIVRIADVVTYEGMAAALSVAGRKVAGRTVRDWSDPDVQAAITLADAIALDLAYQAAGGDGHPLYELYGLGLEMARATIYADIYELVRRSMASIKEHAEAVRAQLACTLPGADADDRREAIRETQEAIAAATNTLALLTQSAGLCTGERVPGVPQ